MESHDVNRCSCGEVHDLDGVNKLTGYIWEGLRLYSKDTPLDRHVMANAFFQVCAYFFVTHSPQNIHGQVQEIENFCKALLDAALNEAQPIQ